MPDYNHRAGACWWAMVFTGSVLLLACLVGLAQEPPGVWLQVGAGMGLAMLAALFPVRIPGTRHSFVASDVVIFVLLLLHGPAAAAVAVAGEAFLGSLRTTKRWSSRIASPAIGAIAICTAGGLLEAVRAALGLGPANTVPLMVRAFSVVSSLTSVLIFRLMRPSEITTGVKPSPTPKSLNSTPMVVSPVSASRLALPGTGNWPPASA